MATTEFSTLKPYDNHQLHSKLEELRCFTEVTLNSLESTLKRNDDGEAEIHMLTLLASRLTDLESHYLWLIEAEEAAPKQDKHLGVVA
jgi:hypothetical protein